MTKFVILHSISQDPKVQAKLPGRPVIEGAPIVSIMYDDIYKIDEIEIGASAKFSVTRLHSVRAGTLLVVETPEQVVKILNEASK